MKITSKDFNDFRKHFSDSGIFNELTSSFTKELKEEFSGKKTLENDELIKILSTKMFGLNTKFTMEALKAYHDWLTD